MAKNNGNQRALKGEAGRLIGWLVSYGLDNRGFNFEIRAGRTFLSSEDEKNLRTLVLSDKSVSHLHLALHASSTHEVIAQDIFSDAGSFITRSQSSEEEPIDGPITLQHGDWIRIGDEVRFQLCLIDGPSR